MASILLVLTSSPASANGERALALSESLADQGHILTLCCLQDGVLLGSDRGPRESRSSLDRLLGRGARWVVLSEDLAARGLTLSSRAFPVDHAGVVALLAGAHDRVIGAL
ncbi:MAG: hypothetical protein HY725_15505 [Candidatus Rokubacteria bacterium]|nr:hypothetical protein [Candidatus Rokubacteria bacterium]